MPAYKELRDRDVELVNDWFKNHKATLQVFEQPDPKFVDTITKLIWSQPGTGINRIIYLIHGSTLFVCGDLGDAVYQWHSQINLDFLSGLNLDYFGGKCLASSEEPRGKTWDPDRAKAFIEEHLAQWANDNPLPCPTCSDIHYNLPEELDCCPTCKGEETVPRTPLTYQQCADLTYEEDVETLDEVIAHAHAWGRWMYEGKGLIVSNQKEKVERDRYARRPVLPEDEEDYPRYHFEDSYDAGYTWDLRTRGHLLGLKMAYKQLNPQGIVEAA
jgi:hypothetical protein